MMMLCALCMSTFLFGLDTKAATSGDIPCSQGAVSWTLDGNGVLTFSGTGTTNIMGEADANGKYKDWRDYWNQVGIDKDTVLSVKVSEGSKIQLDTCCRLFLCFEACTSIELDGFSAENVTNMHSMFYQCSALKEVDLSGLNVKNVKTMRWMFYECRKLEKVIFGEIDTSNVEDMQALFYRCESLSELDVSNFKTQNVKDMAWMFCECKSLPKLNVSEFDTSKVENMRSMFYQCELVPKLDVSNFHTENVTNMDRMFYQCSKLQQLDVSSFCTSKVTLMDYMFAKCSSLLRLDLSKFDTSSVESMNGIVMDCSLLEILKTPNCSFKVSLPNIANGQYWVSTEKEIYTAGSTYTFSKAKEIHRVNKKYNINYVTNGQLMNCPTTYLVEEGEAHLGTIKHPYGSFAGWYLDEAYNNPVLVIEKGTFGDLTLYGKIDFDTFDIAYRNIDGILNQKDLPREYTYGTEKVIPKAIKNNYTFVGWFLDEACTKSLSMITKTTGGDLILYGKWEVNSVMDEQEKQEEQISKPDPTEAAILNNGDSDVKGSSFSLIQARADKTTKTSIRLKWNKVKGADGYLVYGNKCGKNNKYELIKTIDNGKTTSFTHKKCKKSTYYKYTVYAYKSVNGKREKVAVSKTIHATTKGSKYGNVQSVKVNNTKVTLKKNKAFKLKCTQVAEKGRKLKKHRAVCYESSNTQIATVTNKGVIKAKKKGTC